MNYLCSAIQITTACITKPLTGRNENVILLARGFQPSEPAPGSLRRPRGGKNVSSSRGLAQPTPGSKKYVQGFRTLATCWIFRNLLRGFGTLSSW